MTRTLNLLDMVSLLLLQKTKQPLPLALKYATYGRYFNGLSSTEENPPACSLATKGMLDSLIMKLRGQRSKNTSAHSFYLFVSSVPPPADGLRLTF